MNSKWMVAAVVAGGLLLGAVALVDAGQAGILNKAAGNKSGVKALGLGHGWLRELILGRAERVKQLKVDLNLSKKEKQDVKGILEAHRDEIVDAVKPVVQARQELRQAVRAQTTDEQSIRKAADDLGKAIGDAAVVRAKVGGEVRGVLTPAQAQTLQDFNAANARSTDDLLRKLSEDKN